jgi:AcrR family transcriptional regulator
MTSTPGLRERKKVRTRWAIQEHALRLFAEKGYEATTVDQIAAAAEISPSTFFRYFPTKEDVVVQDEYDDVIVEAFRQAGASAEPVRTLRGVLSGFANALPPSEWAKAGERADLLFKVPALRARSIDNFAAVAQAAIDAFAEAAGRPSDGLGVQAFVGACMGALVAVALQPATSGRDVLADVLGRMDRGLALLEAVGWSAREPAVEGPAAKGPATQGPATQ